MKGILLSSPGEVSLATLPYPKRGENEVLLKIVSAGVCGSDISAFKGTSPLVTYPRVLGHELCARVEECSPESGFVKGQRVVAEPYIYCGSCYPCSIGRGNCCENLSVLGVHVDGGMTEYFTHPASLIIPVPDMLSDTQAALAEPLTIALHAIHRAGVCAGEWVAVTGAGAIGNLVCQAALAYGAYPILIDQVEERLELARSLGVEHTINTRQQNLTEEMLRITGVGAHALIEATGASVLIAAAPELVRHSGRVVFVGWPNGETMLNTRLFTFKELDVRGSRNSHNEFPEAVQLIADGRVNVDALVSAEIPFEKLPEYIAAQAAFPGKYMKIVAHF